MNRETVKSEDIAGTLRVDAIASYDEAESPTDIQTVSRVYDEDKDDDINANEEDVRDTHPGAEVLTNEQILFT